MPGDPRSCVSAPPVGGVRRGDVGGLARLRDAEPRSSARVRIVEPECYREAGRPQSFRDPNSWFIANNPL